jgi:hypothetical protein
MNENKEYAGYMLAWLELLTLPNISALNESLVKLKEYWLGNQSVNMAEIKASLWSWVDSNGGSTNFSEKPVLMARLVLCLAYEDNRELEDMGFFEDLLSHYGIPRNEINRYSRGNPPRRT